MDGAYKTLIARQLTNAIGSASRAKEKEEPLSPPAVDTLPEPLQDDPITKPSEV